MMTQYDKLRKMPPGAILSRIAFVLLNTLTYITVLLIIAACTWGRIILGGFLNVLHENDPLLSLLKQNVVFFVFCLICCSLWVVVFLISKKIFRIGNINIDRVFRILVITLLAVTLTFSIITYFSPDFVT